MAYVIVKRVLSSHMVGFADSPGMWHTVSWCFLYLCSHSPNILTPILGAMDFLFPYGCCSATAVYVSATEEEVLFFCLSLQCHLLLLICFLLASIVSCYAPPLLSYVVNLVLYKPPAPSGMHTHVFLHVCLPMDIHTGMSTEELMVLTFILILAISWSLFSVWLLRDRQS